MGNNNHVNYEKIKYMHEGINMSKKDKRKKKDLQAISKPNVQRGKKIKTAGFHFFSNDKFKEQVWKPVITRKNSILVFIAILMILLGGFRLIYL